MSAADPSFDGARTEFDAHDTDEQLMLGPLLLTIKILKSSYSILLTVLLLLWLYLPLFKHHNYTSNILYVFLLHSIYIYLCHAKQLYRIHISVNF